MNQGIELHDSELGGITAQDGDVLVTLSPAYVHSSEGRPGMDAGSGWVQLATLSLSDATVSAAPARLPATIAGGYLRVGSQERSNILPIETFAGAVELAIVLTTGDALRICGQGIRIQLHGEPSFVEDFNP